MKIEITIIGSLDPHGIIERLLSHMKKILEFSPEAKREKERLKAEETIFKK